MAVRIPGIMMCFTISDSVAVVPCQVRLASYLHVFMAPFSESSSAIRVRYICWFSIWTALILGISGSSWGITG